MDLYNICHNDKCGRTILPPDNNSFCKVCRAIVFEKILNQKEPAQKQAPLAPDPVNSPGHYNFAGIECIDAIKAALGPEGFRDYMMGNVLKYSWRYKYKNGIEDLKKAQWYLSRTIKELEDEREHSS